MKTQITSFKELYIPKPCHQDWDKMTPEEQGKFCGNCQKMVYDFSGKTVNDFNVIYEVNKGDICGRFDYDQIDQDFAYIVAIKRNSVLSYVKKIASFLVTFITLKIASVRDGYSQSERDTIRTEIVSSNSDNRKIGRSNEIHGQVLYDKSENGTEDAYVHLYDTKNNLVTTTKTNEEGYFYMVLSPDVNLDQTFRIVAEKDKVKRGTRITRYSSHKKEILQKNFDSVILTMKIHSRWRRNIIGIRRRIVVGCPKFR